MTQKKLGTTIDGKKYTPDNGPSLIKASPEVSRDVDDFNKGNMIACGKLKTLNNDKEMIIVMSVTNEDGIDKMTYEGLDITGGSIKDKDWQTINMEFDDDSDDSRNYYAQFIKTENSVIPLVTMTSQISDGEFRTKLFKLKCKSVNQCEMVGSPRCTDDETVESVLAPCTPQCTSEEQEQCDTSADAPSCCKPLENVVTFTERVWPYTAFRLNDDNRPQCSST